MFMLKSLFYDFELFGLLTTAASRFFIYYYCFFVSPLTPFKCILIPFLADIVHDLSTFCSNSVLTCKKYDAHQYQNKQLQ